jgi:dipeptidase
VKNARNQARVSCDSIAFGPARTRGGRTVFAKNSDRPAGEAQPLVHAASAEHRPGASVHCQYIEIAQAPHTLAFIGSRPHWLWGVEHGVNERGVAIGNHTIFTSDPVAATGLLGMDLVRLALERATTAAEAFDVIVRLIERHGQGGSGYLDTNWPYHNSFLIADPKTVLLLEASAEHWALREVSSAASASNHVSITDDWSRLSSACERHARETGRWNGSGRLDFAAAYRDVSVAPPVISSGRHAVTCRAVAGSHSVDPRGLRRLMRDHGASGELHEPGRAPDSEDYYTVCMHADPVGTTTASMIVELDPEGRGPLWMAMCNPCVAPYLPVFLEGRLPAALTDGGRESGGAWWRFKALLGRAEHDWRATAPLIRDVWRAFEADADRACDAHVRATAGAARAERERANTAFMQETWERACCVLEQLLARLG